MKSDTKQNPNSSSALGPAWARARLVSEPLGPRGVDRVRYSLILKAVQGNPYAGRLRHHLLEAIWQESKLGPVHFGGTACISGPTFVFPFFADRMLVAKIKKAAQRTILP